MRQDLMNMLEEATAKHRTNASLAPVQLEYLAAKSLLDTLREQAEAEYMWDVTSELDNETLEIVAAHDVEVDQKHGVYEAEEYYKSKRDNLIAWSQEMSVKAAHKYGASKKVVQDIVEMHQNINQYPVQRVKLIDIALKLDMRTIR